MEYETKEEFVGIFHEALEWLGPLQGFLKNLKCKCELNTDEKSAVERIGKALQDLYKALDELDRVAEV